MLYAVDANDGGRSSAIMRRACRKRWRWPESALEPTDFQALFTI
jgi:hypothetical protein